MQIFHTEWIDKERTEHHITIDVNLWVIGSFVAGALIGKYYL